MSGAMRRCAGEVGFAVDGLEEAEFLKIFDRFPIFDQSGLRGVVGMVQVQFHFSIAGRSQSL
jgi:hypothetical protein